MHVRLDGSTSLIALAMFRTAKMLANLAASGSALEEV
jgi:hypothetical protein